MPEPIVGRPHMPGYGIAAADAGDGLLPWSWAEERLTNAHNYWVATTNPSGSAALTAVWGVWLEGAFLFSCAPNSTKAKNLARDPRCTVSTERADEAVIVEGEASFTKEAGFLAAFKAAYDPKYNWDMDVAGGIYQVTPRKVLGFIEHSGKFTSTATRWRFDG